MKLIKTGSNTTELTLNNGTVVLFSYNTPVACVDAEQNAYKTNKKFSVTTSKHINQFVPSFAEFKDQAFFDALVA
jgi:hypothetical protein